MKPIIDRFGRQLYDLRISVTQNCNLNCIYCHREGEIGSTQQTLSPAEIHKIIQIASEFGIHKVKITGGEPLLRNDILEIVSAISKVKGIEDISLVTNGLLLAEYAKDLKSVGLDRVNISMDTLDPQKFKQITGKDKLDKALEGIESARAVGLNPIKINTVLLKNINEEDVPELLSFSAEKGAILQLIELVSLGCELEKYRQLHTNIDVIEDYLRNLANKIAVRKMHKRRKYFLNNGSEVEIVRPMHNTEFCANCSRIRLTSDGKLKPCLYRCDNLVDIISPLRAGASDKVLKNLFLAAVDLREPFFKK